MATAWLEVGMGAPPSTSPMDQGAIRGGWPGSSGGAKGIRNLASPPRATALRQSVLSLAGHSPVAVSSGSSGDDLLCQALRKRQTPPAPTTFGASCVYSDEGVTALLPKMKRMRLRPSLGQLRLQREAEDLKALSQQVQLCIEPEQLRAAVDIYFSSNHNVSCGHNSVQFELAFPPQYPHRPPQLMQVLPEAKLADWGYSGRLVLLARLSERCWSSAMGLADIVRDILEALRCGGSSPDQDAPLCCHDDETALRGLGSRFPAVSVHCPPSDVEMA